MAEWLRQAGWSLFVCVVAAPGIRGEAPFEERPQVMEFSPAELELRKADEKVREAQALFGLGVMRHRSDRWLEAVTLLEEAAALDPQAPAAYRALAPLYLSLAREEDALVACQKALKIDPTDSETAFQASKLYRSDGRTREAIAVLAQGITDKQAEDRPDLIYFMLGDLAELQEKVGDYAAAAVSYRRLAGHLLGQKARLLGSETLTPEQHAIATARAYERIGQCQLQRRQYDEAAKAFLESRDFLAKHSDPVVRAKALRLNWNLALTSISQENWTAALAHLDEYLENRPSDPEPYEKKVFVLKKLDRASDIVPALKKYAKRAPDSLAIQLLCARELAETPGGRAEAERRYLDLADRFGGPDVYRGLFKFYMTNAKMDDALQLIDKTFASLNPKDDIAADVRERARDRGRAMLTVLRGDAALVNALLPAVMREVRDPKKLARQTLQFCAALAARARQLDKAEDLFRQCLARAPLEREAALYGALLEVLWMQHKHDAIVALCKEALGEPGMAQATNLELFHRNLALALSEKDQHNEAVREIDKAIKLAAETARVIERCAKARILSRAERYSAAFTECDALLKELTQANEIKRVRFTLAAIYTLKGDHDKSDEQLKKILEDDPNDAEANNDLGYQWADRKLNLDEAEKMIRKAVEVDRLQRRDDPEAEDNAAYLDSLGWVLFRRGKPAEARDWLEKASALPLGAADPTVWDHLGDVYFKLDLPVKAREAWQNAIKLYDHDKRGQKEGRLEEARRKLKMVGE